MRSIPSCVFAAGLLALAATPAAAQGILSKARYAHPVVASLPAGAVTGPALAALTPAGDPAAVPVCSVSPGAVGSAIGLPVDGIDGMVVVGGPGSVPGQDGLPDLPPVIPGHEVLPALPPSLPGTPGEVGIDPGGLVIMPLLPHGPGADAMPGGIESGVVVPMAGATGPTPQPPGALGGPAPGAAGGPVIVTGKPTPAALLRAANAAAAAEASTTSGQAGGFAQQIRDQVRQATGGRSFRPGAAGTIGAATNTFGTPADAKPLIVAGTVPGGPPRSAGPAAGLPRSRPLVIDGAAANLPPQAPSIVANATPAASLRVPAAGGTAPAGNAAVQAGVNAAAGVAGARASLPATTAPRWRDRISFATPLGR